jgi:hypothetical protein
MISFAIDAIIIEAEGGDLDCESPWRIGTFWCFSFADQPHERYSFDRDCFQD